ncbi:MAG: hypothetical protein JXO51_10040 [Candidatus Aminicenantes bacterium]|nr:hypothetical protein [Candidatus Aminicenantes bacterium]
MPGTFPSRLALFILALPLAVAAGTREHEIQFRRNDYPAPVAPARLQAAGISKAILRVFSDDERNGGLYYASGLFPVVRPALDPWAAAYTGSAVRLWAWMGVRKFAWLDDPRLLDREWREGTASLIPKLDLFNPQAQDLIAGLFASLARLPICGILVQDDLAILRNEGFSSWGKASFHLASGLAAEPRRMLAVDSDAGRVWEDLKAQRVSGTLNGILSACRGSNPAVAVGINVHYEAPLTPQKARAWYGFDVQAIKTSAADLFYLMAYHRQLKAEMRLGESENRLYFRRMLEEALKLWGARLAVKLQVRDWKSSQPIPFPELKAYYDLIPAGVDRVCFAAADPEDLDLISKVIAQRSTSVSDSVSVSNGK